GSIRLIVPLRRAGQAEIGPKLVLDQSSARTRAPISPPSNGNSSSRLLGAVPELVSFIASRPRPRKRWRQYGKLSTRQCLPWVTCAHGGASAHLCFICESDMKYARRSNECCGGAYCFANDWEPILSKPDITISLALHHPLRQRVTGTLSLEPRCAPLVRRGARRLRPSFHTGLLLSDRLRHPLGLIV